MDQAARLRELVGKQGGAGGRVIAVTSGKGGVGKTSIAVNLSLALARRHKQVMLLDADLGLANIDILLGLVPRWDLSQVVRGEKQLKDIIVEGPEGILLIPGGSGVRELADLTIQQQEILLESLREITAGMDFLLVDTSAGISRQVLSFVAAAGEGIVVTTPEPTALTDAYGLIKGLSRLKVKLHLVVNRATTLRDGREAAERLQAVAERFLSLKLSFLGVIPEDKAVGLAVREQKPLLIYHPTSAAARAIDEVADRLLGLPVTGRGGGGFFQRLYLLLGSRARVTGVYPTR
ncbi:flagellar biosynthesis protein FlhG [Thermanaeromonas toyohensis ToBE]|uniref:Flagellar biosynthesis protein FlhG n=1 Tax=Thermanaeromonas toyohensis ToBE TaxID=698762 RepID=A0A1W1VLA1_9FIRM|nr:MinD/ParA family protein [Thermanaeromonas toyohensis]SMB94086.1 flagellar biosynthesis protein FlhG [Thermanaeromonas toyohensis ToBE]